MAEEPELTESEQVLSGAYEVQEIQVETASPHFHRMTSGATQQLPQRDRMLSPSSPSDDFTANVNSDMLLEDRDQVDEMVKGQFPQRIYQ